MTTNLLASILLVLVACTAVQCNSSDVNKCAYDNGGCQHQCINSGCSYRCECNSGYYLQADEKSCATTPPVYHCNHTGKRCIEWNNRNICFGDYYTGETCVNGYCRCVDNPNRDYCTCLYKSGKCHIEVGSSIKVGTPTFRGASQTTYSCVAQNDNCEYDVHVISNYEGNGAHGHGIERTTGTTTVNVVSGPNQGTKPLILVFVSYEPVMWILNIPNRVMIERVLLGSYYLDDSSVTGYNSQSVLNIERVPRQSLPSGYGSDDGGGSTDKLLEYVVGRFGPVTSFSGSYRADSWTLNIHLAELAVTISTTPPLTTTPPSTTASTTLHSTAIPPTTISVYHCNHTGKRCIEWNNRNICSGDYYTGETCVNGYCRCVDNPNRDYCTCLYKSGKCHIELGSSIKVGTPTFRGASQTTYSCVAQNENYEYDVHVISNYEGNGTHGFGIERTTGTTTVNIVSGPNQGTKPLILVFISYEPVMWILNIPNGVVIERVLLGAYYLDDSSVTGYNSQSVLNMERVPHQSLPYGYGSDDGGGRTDELLEYVVSRFGPVTSFSGSYRADSWTLNIHLAELAVTTSTFTTLSPLTTTPPPTTASTTPHPTIPPTTTFIFTTTPPPSAPCGGQLTTSSGTFQTPNWPETYPSNIDCEWRIQLPDSNMVVAIRCEEDPFGIAGFRPACSKDFLKFYDGHSKQDTEFGPFCHYTKPSTATMSSNKAMAIFHAGPKHNAARKGFKCSFQSISFSVIPQCGGNLTVASGSFQTPNWPETYPVNIHCTWTIILPDSSQRLEITFDPDFGIAGSLPTCKDKLHIYDDNTDTQYGPYCHFTLPNPPIMTSNKATVEFIAGPSHSPSRVGFRANYRSVV